MSSLFAVQTLIKFILLKSVNIFWQYLHAIIIILLCEEHKTRYLLSEHNLLFLRSWTYNVQRLTDNKHNHHIKCCSVECCSQNIKKYIYSKSYEHVKILRVAMYINFEGRQIFGTLIDCEWSTAINLGCTTINQQLIDDESIINWHVMWIKRIKILHKLLYGFFNVFFPTSNLLWHNLSMVIGQVIATNPATEIT